MKASQLGVHAQNHPNKLASQAKAIPTGPVLAALY